MATPVAPGRARGLPLTLIGAVVAIIGFGLVFYYVTFGGVRTVSLGNSVPVVVAARNVQFRTLLTPEDITVVNYPSDLVPQSSFSTKNQLKDKGFVATVDILKGQPLTANLLALGADLAHPAQNAYLPIPTGFVAFTIPTGEQQGVAGFIEAGDYISVLAIMNLKGAATKATFTVFTNLHVLKVGPSSGTGPVAPGASAPPDKTGGVVSSLTVVVTQCQAEFLEWFLDNGAVKYTLESVKDYAPADAKPDPNCPTVTSAQGVTLADVGRRYPKLVE